MRGLTKERTLSDFSRLLVALAGEALDAKLLLQLRPVVRAFSPTQVPAVRVLPRWSVSDSSAARPRELAEQQPSCVAPCSIHSLLMPVNMRSTC